MGVFSPVSALSPTEQHNKAVCLELLQGEPDFRVFEMPDLMCWPCLSRFRSDPKISRDRADTNRLGSALPIIISPHRRYFPVGLHDHYFSYSYLEFLFVVSGTVLQQVGQFRSRLEPGDVLMIAPGTKHAFFAMQDDCLCYNLMVRLESLEEDMPGIFRSHSELSTFLLKTLYKRSRNAFMVFHTGDYLQGDNRLADLVRLSEQRSPYFIDQAISSTQLLLFDLILHEAAPPLVSLDEDSTSIDPSMLVEYIRSHSSSVTVKELSQVFNYSERQLSRVFTDAIGQPISKYIQQLRTDHFISLLVGSDMQISRAMELAGINSTSRFFSQFREQYGLSPVQYRKEFRATRT